MLLSVPHPPLCPLSLPRSPREALAPRCPSLFVSRVTWPPLWTACLSVILRGSLNHMHSLEPFSIIRGARRVSGRSLGTGGATRWGFSHRWSPSGWRVSPLSSCPPGLEPEQGLLQRDPDSVAQVGKNVRILLRVGCSGTVEGGSGKPGKPEGGSCWESDS